MVYTIQDWWVNYATWEPHELAARFAYILDSGFLESTLSGMAKDEMEYIKSIMGNKGIIWNDESKDWEKVDNGI